MKQNNKIPIYPYVTPKNKQRLAKEMEKTGKSLSTLVDNKITESYSKVAGSKS